jgi:hypothetical protein
MDSTWILGRNLELKHEGKGHMGRSRRRQLIRNQNTKRKDERARNKPRKEDCGKIREKVPSVLLLFYYTIMH